MSQIERIYKIDQWLTDKAVVSFDELLQALEVSRATLKRDIEYMRSRLNAPIEWSRAVGGYRFAQTGGQTGPAYALPRLWFNEQEIHALLTMQHLLSNLDAGGLLGPHIEPLINRLAKLMDAGNHTGAELAKRIKIQTVGSRPIHLPHFQMVGSALLRRQRLVINYHARTTNEGSERELSPQRLIHYRDNWYLDAWCHLRQGLRSFSVDAISQVRVEAKAAMDVPEAELDAVLGSGYGIFAGKQVQWAELRFTAERARWVAAESWHPEQVGQFEADGSYLLRLPYSDPRELLMDVMRHVPDVDVVGPPELRTEMSKRLRAGYEKISGGLSG
jgi:predicted DNA-binding transcriptional regulator YafY